MALTVRQENDIIGIKMKGKEFKIKQYADDTQIFSEFHEMSILKIIEIFDNFAAASGMTINFNKSEILRLWSIRHSDAHIESGKQLVWKNENITVLGITIPVDLAQLTQINVDPIITKIKNLIKIWSWRRLTLYGKNCIINSLLSSQLIYRFTVLPTPTPQTLKEIDQLMFGYLWNNKSHKIAKNIVKNTYNKGGLKMIDIVKKNNALKISWVGRIYKNREYSTCPLLDEYTKAPIKFLLKCNIADGDAPQCWTKKPSQLWIDIFKLWCMYNFKNYREVKDPINEMLWFNSNIKIDSRIVYFKEMHEKGIEYISDLVSSTKIFYTFQQLQEKYRIKMSFLKYHS